MLHIVKHWLYVCILRDIMCEIRRLRLEQEKHAQAALSRGGAASGAVLTRNPVLVAELRGLRQRRDELERRMAGLQSSRRELMSQLEGLMHLLRAVRVPLCLLMLPFVVDLQLHSAVLSGPGRSMDCSKLMHMCNITVLHRRT